MTEFTPVTLKERQTQPIFYEEVVTGAGQLKRSVTLDAPTFIIGIWVSSLSGTVQLKVNTRTQEGIELTIIDGAVISAPTTSLVVEKAPFSFTNFDIIVEHSADATIWVWAKGDEGSQVALQQIDPFDVNLTETGTFDDRHFNSDSTPGAWQTCISETVPTGKQWLLRKAVAACRTEGSFRIVIDSIIKGSGRTGPASPNGVFTWNDKPVNAGSSLQLQFRAVADVAARPLEAYLEFGVVDV